MIALQPSYVHDRPIFLDPTTIRRMQRPSTTQIWVEGYDECIQVQETPEQVVALASAWSNRWEFEKHLGVHATYVDFRDQRVTYHYLEKNFHDQ
ncbi:hypothetical protein HOU02_gp089 [Caulobacter phage CcrBL9]|uniref:Uncharacterized protein n=1 Tax=Caulobacter phage CcrBL9 TaxID=2283270 RepID=A0A385EBE7_9CAUD|nr:hypothetical protein HOU02_gp089 [Caulobacter phage CcrBL9]AXQ69113.1 hypothetical protein CcrBL9_gp089 [Caulobacter phage CcrBL9]